jgi:hypothetical protein
MRLFGDENIWRDGTRTVNELQYQFTEIIMERTL